MPGRLLLTTVSCALLLVAAGCEVTSGEAKGIAKAVEDAAHAEGLHPSPTVLAGLADATKAAQETLRTKLDSLPEDERDAYKHALCAGLQTTLNGFQPDWPALAKTIGVEPPPAVELRDEADSLEQQLDAGTPWSDVGLRAFVDVACV